MQSIQLSFLSAPKLQFPDYSCKPEPSERLIAAAEARGHRISYSVCDPGYWLLKSGVGRGSYFGNLEELKRAIYALPLPKLPADLPAETPEQRSRYALWREGMDQPKPCPDFRSARALELFLEQLKDKGLLEDFALTVHCWGSASRGLYGALPDWRNTDQS